MWSCGNSGKHLINAVGLDSELPAEAFGGVSLWTVFGQLALVVVTHGRLWKQNTAKGPMRELVRSERVTVVTLSVEQTVLGHHIRAAASSRRRGRLSIVKRPQMTQFINTSDSKITAQGEKNNPPVQPKSWIIVDVLRSQFLFGIRKLPQTQQKFRVRRYSDSVFNRETWKQKQTGNKRFIVTRDCLEVCVAAANSRWKHHWSSDQV